MRISLGDRPWQDVKPEECAGCIEKWKERRECVLYTYRRSYVLLSLDDADVLALFYALLERKERDYSAHTLVLFAELLPRLSATCKRLAGNEDVRRRSASHAEILATFGKSLSALAKIAERIVKTLRPDLFPASAKK